MGVPWLNHINIYVCIDKKPVQHACLATRPQQSQRTCNMTRLYKCAMTQLYTYICMYWYKNSAARVSYHIPATKSPYLQHDSFIWVCHDSFIYIYIYVLIHRQCSARVLPHTRQNTFLLPKNSQDCNQKNTGRTCIWMCGSLCVRGEGGVWVWVSVVWVCGCEGVLVCLQKKIKITTGKAPAQSSR